MPEAKGKSRTEGGKARLMGIRVDRKLETVPEAGNGIKDRDGALKIPEELTVMPFLCNINTGSLV